jgi:hypothetical protein
MLSPFWFLIGGFEWVQPGSSSLKIYYSNTKKLVKAIDGHNRRWIDGSIPIVSIDTFGLIFIDVIDPLVKDFFIFDR